MFFVYLRASFIMHFIISFIFEMKAIHTFYYVKKIFTPLNFLSINHLSFKAIVISTFVALL